MIARQMPPSFVLFRPQGWHAVSAGAVAFIIQIIGWMAVGYNLDGYLTGCTTMTAVFPFVLAARPALPDSLATAFAVALGSTGAWLVSSHVPGDSVAGGALLLAVLLSEAGLFRLLLTLRMERELVAAVVCSAVTIWMLWPIWLSTAPPLLVRLHPLLAMNGALSADLSVWTEEPIPYRLTVLGQDAAYTLPNNPWFAGSMYLATGIGLIILSQLISRALRSTGPSAAVPSPSHHDR